MTFLFIFIAERGHCRWPNPGQWDMGGSVVEISIKAPQTQPSNVHKATMPSDNISTNTFWEKWTCVNFSFWDFRVWFFSTMFKLDLECVGVNCLCSVSLGGFLVCFQGKVNHYGVDMSKNVQCISFWAWLVLLNTVFPSFVFFPCKFNNFSFLYEGI